MPGFHMKKLTISSSKEDRALYMKPFENRNRQAQTVILKVELKISGLTKNEWKAAPNVLKRSQLSELLYPSKGQTTIIRTQNLHSIRNLAHTVFLQV